VTIKMSNYATYVGREVGIWRYMDVARFLTMLCEKSLYLASLRELNDPWEGVWTTAASQKQSIRDPEYSRAVIKRFNNLARVSCWHENERESVAMWKLYVSGREGVALKTTVGRLEGALTANSTRETTIARVLYADQDDNPQVDKNDGRLYCEQFLFRKVKAYAHEREVRAMIYHGCDGAQVAFSVCNTGLVTSSANDTPCGTEAGRGEAVPVDLSSLIERIVVSPDFPKWAIGSLQKAVDTAGMQVRVESSALLAPPGKELLGALTEDRAPSTN